MTAALYTLHCPECFSPACPRYLSYGSTVPYRHCRNCGHTFLPGQAVLLRELEPVEPPPNPLATREQSWMADSAPWWT